MRFVFRPNDLARTFFKLTEAEYVGDGVMDVMEKALGPDNCSAYVHASSAQGIKLQSGVTVTIEGHTTELPSTEFGELSAFADERKLPYKFTPNADVSKILPLKPGKHFQGASHMDAIRLGIGNVPHICVSQGKGVPELVKVCTNSDRVGEKRTFEVVGTLEVT